VEKSSILYVIKQSFAKEPHRVRVSLTSSTSQSHLCVAACCSRLPVFDSESYFPHETLLGMTWVSNPATRKDLVARTRGVFWN